MLTRNQLLHWEHMVQTKQREDWKEDCEEKGKYYTDIASICQSAVEFWHVPGHYKAYM